MKSVHSEEYYRKYWDNFMEPTIGEHYMNLEEELAKEMRYFYEVNASADAIGKVEKMYAERIAKRCHDALIEDKKLYLRIVNKTANFGYTTLRQELEAQGTFLARFEFNCLQLRDFRRKYGV